MPELFHASVLLKDPSGSSPVMDLLKPVPGETVLDVTLGLAGHAAEFARRIAPDGELYALETDTENLAVATERLKEWAGHVHLIHANFRDIAALDLPPVDILFADLGLSSPHVDDPERGFSFRFSGPLDLRFDRTSGKSAAELLHSADERDIRLVLSRLGEISEAPRLASQIYKAARQNELRTTDDLVAICKTAFGYRAPTLLPQVFQALRMWVNDELGALEALLEQAKTLVCSGGRIGIISYHSLEDRLVKTKFREWSTPELDPVTGAVAKVAKFTILTRKPIVPSAEECALNPRARSAKFRVIRREMVAENS